MAPLNLPDPSPASVCRLRPHSTCVQSLDSQQNAASKSGLRSMVPGRPGYKGGRVPAVILIVFSWPANSLRLGICAETKNSTSPHTECQLFLLYLCNSASTRPLCNHPRKCQVDLDSGQHSQSRAYSFDIASPDGSRTTLRIKLGVAISQMRQEAFLNPRPPWTLSTTSISEDTSRVS
ncbi:hypothetical protein N431DRAFT_434986 [Stipitochalara longipes BDJ]|nr:hypothetical protein N431DRAFT_434986 [Stipitochalara longipes BDJ]